MRVACHPPIHPRCCHPVRCEPRTVFACPALEAPRLATSHVDHSTCPVTRPAGECAAERARANTAEARLAVALAAADRAQLPLPAEEAKVVHHTRVERTEVREVVTRAYAPIEIVTGSLLSIFA